MKRLSWFAWAISIVLSISFGIIVCYMVLVTDRDLKIMDLEARLKAAQATEGSALAETAYWQGVLTRLVEGEGGQLEGVEMKEK